MAKRISSPDVVIATGSCFHIFLLSGCFLGIIIFLYGFFPIKYVSRDMALLDDLPCYIKDVRVDPKEFYFSRVDQLVFIVVDALRWDFLTKSENALNVPYITTLLSSGKGCLFHAECSSPTVTMPRLKALMTGSVPNFIDVMLNLGSSEIKGDSLIAQAVKNDKNIVFYGDDTWLKMFPSSFLRSEGTTSFFVSDFEEVDQNVTRHIPKELASSDWNILILHYLGLDHIGHTAGPSSPLVGPKLQEMDKVVEMIFEGLNSTRKKSPPPLLVLVGDHGMRNSGGHGGSTPDEILTSLLFLKNGCSSSKWFKQRVWQTDVTATLAVLLGLPIPHNSVGTILSGVLSDLPPLHHLYALHYNAQHLKKLATGTNCLNEESVHYLNDGQNKFEELLKSKIDIKLYDRCVWLYETASFEMSQCLANSNADFHVVEMISGCVILFVIVVSLIETTLLGVRKSILPKSVLMAVVAPAIVAAYIFMSISSVVIIFTSALIAYSIGLLLFPQSLVVTLIRKIREATASTIFIILGCTLHTISLFGSSLIEEEHQTWYFFWTSLSIIKLYTLSVRIYSDKTKEEKLWKSVLQLLFLVVAHRCFRTLNQTGNKWADLPDTGDWLRQPENWLFHLAFTVAGLIGIWASLPSFQTRNVQFYRCASAAALFFALLCRAANGEVQLTFSYPKSKGGTEGNCFWLLVLVISFHQMWETKRVLETITSFIILTLSLILRPHNLVILPFLTYASRIIFSVYPLLHECTLIHAWMGSVAFFYQGNSNSLTTVDVAAGYVGASDHNMLRVGLLVFLHTYAAPILSFLLLIIGIARNKNFRQNIHASLQVYTLQKLIPLLTACFICLIHRHHLFVWSVFAPKLLYEAMSSVTVLTLVTPVWLMLSFTACAKTK